MAAFRIALVGTGFTLHTQLPAFRLIPETDVTDLIGRDRQRTESLAHQHGIPRASTSLDEVLARRDVDLVCIATPPDLHQAMAEATLAAGAHVLCEKPMAIDVGAAESMCNVAATATGLACIDHQLRFLPNARKMCRLIHDGYLGRPLHVLASLRIGSRLDPQRPFNWWSERRRGGGIVGALGSHVIDLLRWMLGDVSAVCCTERTFVSERTPAGALRARPVDSEDHAAFWLRHGESIEASVVVSAVAHNTTGLQLEVYGDDGMLELGPDGGLRGNRRQPDTHRSSPSTMEPLDEAEPIDSRTRRQIPDTIFGRGFLLLAQSLVAALRRGDLDAPQLEPLARFADGLAVQRVLDALHLSAAERRWIDLDPDPS